MEVITALMALAVGLGAGWLLRDAVSKKTDPVWVAEGTDPDGFRVWACGENVTDAMKGYLALGGVRTTMNLSHRWLER